MSSDFVEIDELQSMGPIDYLVVQIPKDRVTGEGLLQLVDLAQQGIIRILDLAFAAKDPDGKVVTLDIHDLGDDGDALSAFEGARSGLLDTDDLAEAASVLDEDTIAGVLVYENRWAAPLATTLRRNGAEFVAGGRIPVQALLAALDAAEARASA